MTAAGASAFNNFGDVQAITDPLDHVTMFGYNANRNRTSTTDAHRTFEVMSSAPTARASRCGDSGPRRCRADDWRRASPAADPVER